MNFTGKVAIVTGGAKGIGKAYTKALLNIGMKVCVCDILEEQAKRFFESLPTEQRNNIIFQKCDVTSFAEFKNAFDKVISTFGRIDVLVNNAGIISEKNFQKMIEVNVNGVVHGTQLAFEHMSIERGGHGGYIINTASEAGLEPTYVAPVYCATKHAIVGLTKSLGHEYHFKKTGIKVNAVCPGLVETDMCRTLPERTVDEEEAKKIIALMTTIKPEEVAKALLQLLQDDKNGAVIRIDSKGLRYV
ncbi:15-hydroxyprostaglandin dehydrogenase [Trichonephila inaurata madagascariensis]|uniref:15-hydroxyprostaglandin dehydrogenase [NAD(+)] n=1 Tax=Trichonephila inaurata madagascariensis TaxID=2747483 RepID=A0A8X6YQ55_9ARAC|nr:15-hydroxyprostaglandin dehydrogenase [Trichonephila inaurata madagascariensis]